MGILLLLTEKLKHAIINRFKVHYKNGLSVNLARRDTVSEAFSIFLGKAAGVLSFVAFFPYIISILRGQTKPNRATWWIWTVVGIMLGASYYSSGARYTMWVPISYVVGPFIIALVAIKYGEGGWTRFDRGCLVGVGISLLAWWLLHSPQIALFINIFIDFLGALPTIRKAYENPLGEDRLAWIIFFLGNTANLLAVNSWSLTIISYPLYMLLSGGLITALVCRPRT
jgi:hypothetical protein